MPRTRNLFDPSSDKPFKLSRSRLDRFRECARCFYLDRRLGLDRVPGFPFTLNSATDVLLKKEFDHYREQQQPHPLMVEHGIDAIPYQHPQLDDWRFNFKGVQFHHAATNLLLTGAVDDIWVDTDGILIVVDYKSTSSKKPITLDDAWKIGYKRQMEFYQWLLRQNGFIVSDVGYFVYVNAMTDRTGFYERLEFETHVLAYRGSDKWVEPTVTAAAACLRSDDLPASDYRCKWCKYRQEILAVEQ